MTKLFNKESEQEKRRALRNSQKLKLVIEIDGDSHFVDDEKRYEKKRQKFIESFSITFLRFTNNEDAGQGRQKQNFVL